MFGGNQELLILTASSNIFGHGNELNDQIAGNCQQPHQQQPCAHNLHEGSNKNDAYQVDSAPATSSWNSPIRI